MQFSKQYTPFAARQGDHANQFVGSVASFRYQGALRAIVRRSSRLGFPGAGAIHSLQVPVVERSRTELIPAAQMTDSHAIRHPPTRSENQYKHRRAIDPPIESGDDVEACRDGSVFRAVGIKRTTATQKRLAD